MNDIYKVAAEQFCLEGDVLSNEPYGDGHIGVTHLVKTTKKNYILQKINHFVFPNVKELMENIERVTKFMHDRGEESLTLIPTKAGGFLFFDGENYFRTYLFIENTISYQIVTDERIFRNAGKAFGEFQNALADFDASLLHETISQFHDTPKRVRDFEAALKANASGRADTCRPEIEFVLSKKDTLDKVVKGLASGEIPLRVTHNDTKLNNILMDAQTGEARAIIDLDTVMPGSMLYDFGDAIRFGASTAAEDEKDLSKVHFSVPYFKAYAEGFYGAVRDKITPAEKALLPYSAYLMMMECGIRFLADYLAGDVYFATAYPEHNLIRCRTQFRLAEETAEHFVELNAIIDSL